MKRAALCLLLLLAACTSAPHRPYGLYADAPPASYAWQDEDEDEGPGVLHTVLLYIPNRVFDILDIVRARVRVGPGFALDLRATEFADFFLGAYTSIFVGIPGPRTEPEINWPFGIESRAGAEVSIIDASTGVGTAPDYGYLECGLGFQVLIIGIDIGVDPWELVDFALGIVTLDPEGDDL